MTKTSKPSTDGAFFASWLVIEIFHTKLSAGRRNRSASATMSAAWSARAGPATPSRRLTSRPSAQPHSRLRRKPRTPYQIDHAVSAAVNGIPVGTLTATMRSTSRHESATRRSALRSNR